MKTFILCALFCLISVVTVSAESGSISVYNSGGFISQFYVEWENKDGKLEKGDSEAYPLGMNKTINIPDGAKNVKLKVVNWIFFGHSADIFNESFLGPVTKCYKIWGVSLDPRHAEIPCQT